MAKNHLPWLVLVALGMALLLWYDNRPDGEPSGRARIADHAAQLSKVRHDFAGDPPSGKRADGTTAASLTADGALTNPLSSLDKESLKDMVERPLFASSRQRPPPVEVSTAPVYVPPPPPPKAEPPSYALLGVVSDGDRAIALLRNKKDGRNLRVEVGDMIGGWQVSAVEAKSVLLERHDGTSQKVQLSRE